MYFKKNVMFNVAECNLGKVKLEPMLTAAVCGGHVGGGGVAHLQALL